MLASPLFSRPGDRWSAGSGFNVWPRTQPVPFTSKGSCLGKKAPRPRKSCAPRICSDSHSGTGRDRRHRKTDAPDHTDLSLSSNAAVPREAEQWEAWLTLFSNPHVLSFLSQGRLANNEQSLSDGKKTCGKFQTSF